MSKPRFEHHNFYILFEIKAMKIQDFRSLNKNSNLHNLPGIKATKARISIKQSFLHKDLLCEHLPDKIPIFT